MTQDTKPICSIIIRSYNEEDHIERLLTGLLHQSLKNVEIIIVDSGSTDQTLSIASNFPVKILQISPRQFTFGRSLNLGIQQATGEFLVFASAHVYPVYPDWLERLLEPFEDPQIALTYGKQRGGKESKFSEKQIFSSWYPDTAQQYQDTAFCNNANAAVRRALTLQYPYDESLPGLEDLDWAQRIKAEGYQIRYVPEAEVIHVHQETPKAVYNRYKREAIAFKHIYIHERFGFIDFVRLTIRNIIRDMQYAHKQKVLWKNLLSIFWFRACQFWGTYQGYRHHGPLTWSLRQRFYYPNGIEAIKNDSQREVKPIKYQE